MAKLIDINSLTITFENKDEKIFAVNNLSFQLAKGETIGIVGESGSGKSITSFAIMQLLPHIAKIEAGQINYYSEDGACVDILKLSEDEKIKLRGKHIAMIFQEPMTSLNPVYRCGRQVDEVLKTHLKLNSKDAKKRTLALFEEVLLPSPEKAYNSYPHQLSGGQKQRIMIAMAIACKPDLLIADEPTTALDVTVQKSIIALLKELQQKYNMGMIFITHDLGVIAEISHKIMVMYKGKVVETGSNEQILFNPQHPYTKSLLACKPSLETEKGRLPVVSDFLQINVNGEISAKSSSSLFDSAQSDNNSFATIINNAQSISQAERSRSLERDNSRSGEIYKSQPILRVENLNVDFSIEKNFFGKTTKNFHALDNITFDVYKGETLGLVGESGCGKTTLGRTIVKLIEASSGNITFKDKNLTQLSKKELNDFRRSVQIVFQDPYSSLNPRHTVGETLIEPLTVHGILKKEKERRQKVLELLQKVGLQESHFYRYPHEFSGGQRQRIVIARALALNPEFIICDESVSALDVSVQAQVLNLLNDLKQEFGFTYIFISHDLSVVKFMSDRMVVMNKGKIEEMGFAKDIYQNPQSEYTKRLLRSIPKL
ncbi:MAG: ABC transporter ATP-binding protein [Bacteroidota bacterium]